MPREGCFRLRGLWLLFLVVLLFSAAGCVSYGDVAVDSGGVTDSQVSVGDDPEFSETAAEAGLVYEGLSADDVNEINSGVYVSDFDRDLQPDLLTIGGDSPVLWRNHGGEFRRSGELPEIDGYVKSALFLDHDNDGWEDLLLLRVDGSPVFLENTGGGFERKDVGLDVTLSVPWAASTADYTGNGCLDVFVVQMGDFVEHRPVGYNQRGISIEEDNGNPNHLFAGDCGSFEETTAEAGIRGEAWSMATSFVDVDGDGLPDIHVANDFNNDVVYFNEGDGTFQREVLPDFTDRNGMSSLVADLTGDGSPEIYVTNIYDESEGDAIEYTVGSRVEGNNLIAYEGNGSFTDLADDMGLRRGGWGWAALAVDFLNDGDRDVLHETSADFGVGSRYPSLFVNRDGGYELVDSSAKGLEETDGFGVVSLDHDLDGDRDLATSNMAGGYKLYENVADTGGSVQVLVESDADGTSVGSRVYVDDGERSQLGISNSKADLLSQDSRYLHFGVGEAADVDVRVEFPDGAVRELEVEPNTRFTVSREGVEQMKHLTG